MAKRGASVQELAVIAKRLRMLSLQVTSKAGSGHPTSCMSIADIIACLFFREMRFDVKDKDHPGNDEFILSKGHAAPILWAAYAEAGIISHKELFTLREISSVIEGHPTPRMGWVKVATGSLGQGLSVGVGMALANRVRGVDARVFVMLGDGECAEGSVWEAANAAAFHRLSSLVAIVDVNRLGQSRATMHEHDADAYVQKFRSFGWHAVCIDGHNIDQIITSFEQARKAHAPTAIVARTFKGKGVSFMENKDGWHGKAASSEELGRALGELGMMPQPIARDFISPPQKLAGSSKKESSAGSLPKFDPAQKIATREAFGIALASYGSDTRIVAIDADVKNSTFLQNFFSAYPQRSFESFIAEQNMVGMAVGFSAKGFIPVCATFSAFLTRAHDQLRMAAYSEASIVVCGSHSGVSIGEDGASQMGLEDIAMMRSIPGSVVFFPCDAVSTAKCLGLLVRNRGIGYLRTVRPKTPVIYRHADIFSVGGSRIVRSSKKDAVTIVAAGVSVHEAMKAAQELKRKKIEVCIIDAYSIKPLDVVGIQKAVRKTKGRIVVVEDHYEAGGLGEAVFSSLTIPVMKAHLCVREIPRSGPPDALMDLYGVSARHIVKAVLSLVKKGA